MSHLEAYRDDGPLAAVLSRLARQPWPLSATAAGALALAWALWVDGAEPSWRSVAGASVFAVVAAIGQRRPAPAPLLWLVPPLLRAAEYGTVVYLGWRSGGSAPVAAFALLGAVAFHQYDVDHRLRMRGAPPPRTVGHVGLGWDGRVLVMTGAAALEIFGPAAIVLAAALGLAAVAENLLVWRHSPPPRDQGGAAALDAAEK